MLYNQKIKQWILANCFVQNENKLKGVDYKKWLIETVNQSEVYHAIEASTSPSYVFSERIKLYLDSTYNHTCLICGIEIPQYHKIFCSYKCSNKFTSNNKCIKDRKKATNIEKYGYAHTFQSEIVKDRSKNTLIKKYGVDNPQKSQVVRDKCKATNIEKYGCAHTFQSEIVKDKIKATTLEKYGVTNPSQSDIIK